MSGSAYADPLSFDVLARKLQGDVFLRSEDEVVNQILKFAEGDDNVRAVIRTDLMPERDYLFAYNFSLS